MSPVQNALAAPFVRLGVAPSQLTLCAIPLSFGAALLCVGECWLWAFAFAVLAVSMDFLDGAVARVAGKATPYGNFLDAVTDRLVEGFLLCGLAYHYPLPATLALTLSLSVSYIKARAGLVVISDNRDWPGVGDRADRVALILLALWVQSQGFGHGAVLILWALVLLAGTGCVQRIRFAKTLIESSQLLPYLESSPPN